MTPLDLSHLEVFLGIFLEFFHFFNFNLNFEFGPVWYRPKPEPVRTGLTGNWSNRTGYRRLGKPWVSPGNPPPYRCPMFLRRGQLTYGSYKMERTKKKSRLKKKINLFDMPTREEIHEIRDESNLEQVLERPIEPQSTSIMHSKAVFGSKC